VAESVIIARDVALAEATGSRLHVCHVSTAESVDVLRWAKKRGIRVTAEATPHHLYLTTPEVVGYDTTFKVNPPLRTDEHVEAGRAALADGIIDAVATDHAPHAPQDKDHAFVDARPGMLGLEQALAVVMKTMVAPGRLTWQQVADRMSHTPARIGKATGQGRPLNPGEPANLVLIDPPYDLSEEELTAILSPLIRREDPWLTASAVVVVERSRRSAEPTWPEGMRRFADKRYGETTVWFAEPTTDPVASTSPA